MCDVIRRLRNALRPGWRPTMLGSATRPSASRSTDRLGTDAEARHVLFDWSMAEFVEHYLDRRAPADRLSRPGSDRHQRQPLRSRHRVHPLPPFLGPSGRHARYVGICQRRHGHGLFLSLRCRARSRSGRCPGVPVAQILPGEGVCSKPARKSPRPSSISNADPRRDLACSGQPTQHGEARSSRVPIEGCTVKLNVLLNELPNFLPSRHA